jgi:PPE-repeat protein
MDFGLYPPEINSGRMYAGPGSGPLLAAAQAWDGLTDQLYAAASQYQSVISGLTAKAWSGPSAESMAAAAASHIDWLSITAAQAEDTAAQAKAAAAAYEAAFASTVPPEAVAANRTLLTALIATNFFGQNLPAIAATEAQYAEMWAQDAAAMYVYAGSSAAATALTPFVSPHQNTDASGSARQAAAVSQAAETSAGNAQSTVTGASQALSAAAAPAQADPLGTLSNLITVFLSAPTDLVTLFGIIPADALSGPVDFPIAFLGSASGSRIDDIVSGWNGEEGWPGTAPAPVKDFPATITNPGQSAAATASASVGEADAIGGLSVPQAWTVAAPEIRNVALALPAAGDTAAAASAVEASSGSAFNQLGLAGMMGPGMAGPAGGDAGTGGDTTKVGQRMPVRSAGGAGAAKSQPLQPESRIVVTGVAAKIREIAKLRDEGRLTEEEYNQQKNRLLGR